MNSCVSIAIFTVLLSSALLACGGDDSDGDDNGSDGDPDVTVGDTVVVAVVNPEVNDGHSTGTPNQLGSDRDGVAVRAEPGEEGTTVDGLVVLDVARGTLDLTVGDAEGLPLTVSMDGDVYDAPLGYDGGSVAFFDNTPIRYAVGERSGAFFYAAEDDSNELRAKLDVNNAVVVLAPGTYAGDFDITADGVTLFATGWSERAVTIDGSLLVSGTRVRVRGVTVNGNLTANGNEFGISFSVIRGITDIKGNGGAFLRNVFCGSAKVPSSNATLLDNYGVPPLESIPIALAEVCTE